MLMCTRVADTTNVRLRGIRFGAGELATVYSFIDLHFPFNIYHFCVASALLTYQNNGSELWLGNICS